MVNPKIQCRKHLLGEHVELHMLVGSLKRKKSIDGFVRNSLVELTSVEARHEALVTEMQRRGYNHASPLVMPDISYLPDRIINAKVDREAALTELVKRCDECKRRMQNEMDSCTKQDQDG